MNDLLSGNLLSSLQEMIIFLGALGLLSCLVAILGVQRQLRAFRKTPNPFDIDITADVTPAAHATKIREILKLPPSKLVIGKRSSLRKHFNIKTAAQQAEDKAKISSDLHHLIIEPISFIFAPFSFVFSLIGRLKLLSFVFAPFSLVFSQIRRLLAWWYAPQHLLQYRVEPMLTVAEATDRNRRLPSIDDLHEWSLDREFGRPCVSLHRLVVSSLLIMGILGTLLGVHICLESAAGNSKTILEQLPPALTPSMMAVGFTIVLAIFKGIYSTKLENLLGKLDRYTLDTLVPALQPADSFEDMDTAMSNTLQSVNDLIKRFGTIVSATVDAGRAVSTYAHDLQQAIDCVKEICDRLGEAKECSESAAKSIGAAIKKLGDIWGDLSSHFKDMNADAGELRALNREVCESLNDIENKYIILGKGIESGTQELTAELDNLRVHEHSYDGLDEIVNSLKQKAPELADLRTRASRMQEGAHKLSQSATDAAKHTGNTRTGLESICKVQSDTVAMLEASLQATTHTADKQQEHNPDISKELIALTETMQEHCEEQRHYVEDINKHSQKYHEPLYKILNPVEWVALLLVILTILKLLA